MKHTAENQNRKDIHRWYLIIGQLAVLVTIVAVIVCATVNLLHEDYSEARTELVREHDEHLFDLAYCVDVSVRQQMDGLMSKLDYLLKRSGIANAERELLSGGSGAPMRECVIGSHMMTECPTQRILIFHGDEILFSSAENEHGCFEIMDDYDDDPVFLVRDILKDTWYLALGEPSPRNPELWYYALFDIEEFYDICIGEGVRDTNWIVLYDPASDLLMQNHGNQAAYLLLREEEIRAREDGYTFMLEHEESGSSGSLTYRYASPNSPVGDQRMVIMVRNETANGCFAIGIANDSTWITELLAGMRRKQILVSSVIVITALASVSLIALLLSKLAIQWRREQAKLEYAKLETELQKAQTLNSLSQMRPHFLYNALSSIREVIHINPQYASDLLCDFATHLRACIRILSNPEPVAFSDELANIRAYVNIEQMRFSDKLHVIYDIRDEDFKVVPLGIEPLVENAIRHGVFERDEEGGTVTIRTYSENGAHVVKVIDDGVGFNVEKTMAKIENVESGSVGLKTTIMRFRQTQNAEVTVKSVPGTGTEVTVTIPNEDSSAKMDVG